MNELPIWRLPYAVDGDQQNPALEIIGRTGSRRRRHGPYRQFMDQSGPRNPGLRPHCYHMRVDPEVPSGLQRREHLGRSGRVRASRVAIPGRPRKALRPIHDSRAGLDSQSVMRRAIGPSDVETLLQGIDGRLSPEACSVILNVREVGALVTNSTAIRRESSKGWAAMRVIATDRPGAIREGSSAAHASTILMPGPGRCRGASSGNRDHWRGIRAVRGQRRA